MSFTFGTYSKDLIHRFSQISILSFFLKKNAKPPSNQKNPSVVANIESEYLGWRFYPIHNSTIVPRIYLRENYWTG